MVTKIVIDTKKALTMVSALYSLVGREEQNRAIYSLSC